ncbi:flagellin [Croceicoccus marinus]|uniref:Flagellin n=1 Tax=Croceicoccus marinus TaxID=450378 RepID=A0A1Z1FAX2_9SPHN|nr:flagellin [Croceicoccus marinus]ARU15959.1 flagellin [Croceicoccus marinus]
MSVINTNISAMKASNASISANRQLGTAMERLSTGKRINSAKDDAAGLAISTGMTSQIRGMSQAIRNANDGISLAQTAEGSLSEVNNILQRMRELSVQSSSGTYQNTDRTYLQAEVTELQKQLVDIADTEFNGVALFDATADKNITIQVGANSTDQLNLKITQLNLVPVSGAAGVGTPGGLSTALAAGHALIGSERTVTAEDVAFSATMGGAAVTTADIGNTVTLAQDDTFYLPEGDVTVTGGINIATAAGATAAIDSIDTALAGVATTRASLGAGQSRLESAVNNLTSNVTNLSDARSRIEDTDYSVETTALAKAQILSQASTAMLSQANQSQQNVMSLLR